MNYASARKKRKCRISLTPSRVKREALAERLDSQWREIRQHSTIEVDLEKMLRLTAENDQRKRRADAAVKRAGRLEP